MDIDIRPENSVLFKDSESDSESVVKIRISEYIVFIYKSLTLHLLSAYRTHDYNDSECDY